MIGAGIGVGLGARFQAVVASGGGEVILTDPAYTQQVLLDNGSLPLSKSYTPTADTLGVFIMVFCRTGPVKPVVSVGGVAARHISSVGVDYLNNTTPDTENYTVAAVFYSAVSGVDARNVSVSLAGQDDTALLNCEVLAVEVQGLTIRSISAHNTYVRKFDGATAKQNLSLPVLSWTENDLILDGVLLSQNPTLLTSTEIHDFSNGPTSGSIGVELPASTLTGQTRSILSDGFRKGFGLLSLIATSEADVSIQHNVERPGWVYARTPGTSNGAVPLSGTYYGTPASGLQVRVMNGADDTEAVTWTAVDTVSGGNWSTSLTVPQGGDYYLQMRETGGAKVFPSKIPWSVGVIVALYGQSNMANLSGAIYATPIEWVDAKPHGLEYEETGNFRAPSRPGERKLHTSMGIPIITTNKAVGGVALSRLSKASGYGFYEALLAFLEDIGQHVEYICWSQGEQDAVAGTPTYAADLEQLRLNLETDLGQSANSLTMFVSSLLHTSAVSGTDALWTSIDDELLEASTTYANIIYSHPDHDLPRIDGYHSNGEGYEKKGARFAHAMRVHMGLEETDANFVATTAAKTSTTTTTVTLSHGLGTDFTPTTGIVGFEVSTDNFATTLAISTAARASATSIVLTHADAGAGARQIRYLFGRDPCSVGASGTPTGLVVDDGALAMPLRHVTTMDAV